MQKRPNSAYAILNDPVYLPADFPVTGNVIRTHSPDVYPVTQLHVHNCLEIGYCYEGEGIFIIDNQIIPFAKGDVSLIPAGRIHIAQSHRENISHWQFIFFDPRVLLREIGLADLSTISNIVDQSRDLPTILSLQTHPEIAPLVLSFIHELQGQQPHYQSAVKGLIWCLMAKLSRMALECSAAKAQATPNAATDLMRIGPALNYIATNYMYPIIINDLSALCNMSTTNFRRIFHQCIRFSPLEYIVQVRVKNASVLLRTTDHSILTVSLMAGFASQSGFNRYFKKIMGITPLAWRKRDTHVHID